MAKISARGDTKVATWKHPNGRRLVLTAQGRLLGNWLKGDGLSLFGKGYTVERAERYAAKAGFFRTAA